MRIGIVTGPVWSTKKSPALTGQILLCVEAEGTQYIAADLVGAGEGDRVILTFGAAARFEQQNLPVDAAIVAILDEMRDMDVSR